MATDQVNFVVGHIFNWAPPVQAGTIQKNVRENARLPDALERLSKLLRVSDIARETGHFPPYSPHLGFQRALT